MYGVVCRVGTLRKWTGGVKWIFGISWQWMLWVDVFGNKKEMGFLWREAVAVAVGYSELGTKVGKVRLRLVSMWVWWGTVL